MKTFYAFLFFSFCTLFSFSQETNQQVIIADGHQFLVGKTTLEALESAPYNTWFNPNYEAYNVDLATITAFKEKLNTYHILVFLGTWCGDSKRETPKFIRVLKEANFPMKNLKIITLDRRKDYYKKSPTGEEWGLQIKKVPTFIFLKDGKEVNRIVENPIVSLEKDIQTILMNNQYTPNYADLMKSK